MARITEDFSRDDERVEKVLHYLPRPWKVAPGKRGNRDIWTIQAANGKTVRIDGRGVRLVIVNAVNGFYA